MEQIGRLCVGVFTMLVYLYYILSTKERMFHYI